MANAPKSGIREKFNAIAAASDIDSLNRELADVTSYGAEDRKALISLLEDHVVTEMNGDIKTAEEWDQVAEAIDVSNALMGGQDRHDTDSLFPMHRLLAMSDTVVGHKGKQAAPVLVDLMTAAANLSNSEYQSAMTLSHVLIDAARKNAPSQKDLDAKPNPFRGKRYGGPHN